MARDGFKIFDSDTHVGPSMNVLDKYLSAADKGRLADWEAMEGHQPAHRPDHLHKRRA